MRFLAPAEWKAWCVGRGVPLRQADWTRPAIDTRHYHVAKLPYPKDSGEKVNLARQLFALIASEGEALVLVDDWEVWPSSQHMPLVTRFREAFGEHRSLIEAPGQLVDAADTDDAVSIIAMSLLFFWDCYGISSTGRDAFYVSHDEYCYFASRDATVAARVTEQWRYLGGVRS
jgi:hypothetical protein